MNIEKLQKRDNRILLGIVIAFVLFLVFPRTWSLTKIFNGKDLKDVWIAYNPYMLFEPIIIDGNGSKIWNTTNKDNFYGDVTINSSRLLLAKLINPDAQNKDIGKAIIIDMEANYENELPMLFKYNAFARLSPTGNEIAYFDKTNLLIFSTKTNKVISNIPGVSPFLPVIKKSKPTFRFREAPSADIS